MLIDIPSRENGGPHADLRGILTAINDLAERQPERFGSPVQFAALKARLADARRSIKNAFNDQAFYEAFAAALDAEGLTPFADQSIALVGCWSKHHEAPSYEPARCILNRFGHFYDMAEAAGSALLTSANALDLTQGAKVDYVITGNVLNAPDNSWRGHDTLIACAGLLKADGRAIHMLNYGDDDRMYYIDNPLLHRIAGQTHLYNIPDGPYRAHGRDLGCTEMMVLAQAHEITPSEALARDFTRLEGLEERTLQTLEDSSGRVRVDLNTLRTHLYAHPERLRALPSFHLVLPPHVPETTLRSRDAKHLLRVDGFHYDRPIEKGAPILPEEIERIRTTYISWRDGLIATLAAELEKPGPAIAGEKLQTQGAQQMQLG